MEPRLSYTPKFYFQITVSETCPHLRVKENVATPRLTDFMIVIFYLTRARHCV